MSEGTTNPFLSKTVGASDTQSRTKAATAHQRAKENIAIAEPGDIPRGVDGQPMMKIVMTAAELIPTGQYANVSVGPAQITTWIDPNRVLAEGESYFSQQQRDTIAQALNELADVVEGDVVAVQRNLVMESIQSQVAAENGK